MSKICKINQRRYLALQCLIGASLLLLRKYKMKRKRKNRRWWIRPINLLKTQQSHFYNLYNEMRLSDPDSFFNYTRMTATMFDKLLQLVECKLRKNSNRPSISPACRLLLTLR